MLAISDDASEMIGEILQVLNEIRSNWRVSESQLRIARIDAQKAVAKWRGVDRRTVADKCQRQLGLNGVEDFDRLVFLWLRNGDTSLQILLENHLVSTPASIDLQEIRLFFGQPTVIIPPGPVIEDASNLDEVSLAFDIVLEKLHKFTSLLKLDGSRAFEASLFEIARARAERCTEVEAFRSRVSSLRNEWQVVSKTK